MGARRAGRRRVGAGGHPRLAVVNARILVGPEERLDPVCAEMAASPLPPPDGVPGAPLLGFVACAAMVRTDAFLTAGGFDPVVRFPGEEERLALDLARLGWAMTYLDDVVVHHHPSPRRHAPDERVRAITRASVLTGAMRLPWRRAVARGWRAARAGAPSRAGVRDALRELPAAWRARHRIPAHVLEQLDLLERPAPAGPVPTPCPREDTDESAAGGAQTGRSAGPRRGDRGRRVPRQPPVRDAPGPGLARWSAWTTSSPGRRRTSRACWVDPGFELVHCDVTENTHVRGDVDLVLHFASPASPVDYLELPIETLRVGSVGTERALRLAWDKGARFVLASTSEVYGDPQVHPQGEDYWGHVNPIGPRGVYDEAKRYAEALVDGLPVHARRRHRHRADLQHLRPADAAPRRAGDPDLHPPGARRRAADRGRRRQPDPVGVLRRRPGGRGARDGRAATTPGRSTSATRTSGRCARSPRTSSPPPARRPRIDFVPRPVDDPEVRRPDTTRAREVLGWSPRVPWEEGLGRTVEWFARALSETA